MTDWAIGWRIFVIVVLVGLAWSVPNLLGMDEWVGLVVGVILGIGLFFTLGLGNARRPPAN
jgi:hypothetical protein